MEWDCKNKFLINHSWAADWGSSTSGIYTRIIMKKKHTRRGSSNTLRQQLAHPLVSAILNPPSLADIVQEKPQHTRQRSRSTTQMHTPKSVCSPTIGYYLARLPCHSIPFGLNFYCHRSPVCLLWGWACKKQKHSWLLEPINLNLWVIYRFSNSVSASHITIFVWQRDYKFCWCTQCWYSGVPFGAFSVCWYSPRWHRGSPHPPWSRRRQRWCWHGSHSIAGKTAPWPLLMRGGRLKGWEGERGEELPVGAPLGEGGFSCGCSSWMAA